MLSEEAFKAEQANKKKLEILRIKLEDSTFVEDPNDEYTDTIFE